MEYLNETIISNIASELKVKVEQVNAVLELLKDEKTVAFIARYRKELTGGLDEEAIRKIEDEYNYGVNLLKRKEKREPQQSEHHVQRSRGWEEVW